MKNDSKYYEYDPARAIVFLLADMFGKSHLKIMTYFLSPTYNFPRLYTFRNGIPNLLSKKSNLKYPERSAIKEKVRIQKINNVPIVQFELNPQRTFLDENSGDNNILTLRFYNPVDGNWDFVFIMIDKKLINLVELKMGAAGLNNLHKKELYANLKSYFSISYPFLDEIAKNEYRKFEYTKELISILEKTISKKSHLENLIIELEKNRKSDLVTKVNTVLEQKAFELNKEIRLSEKALEYIFHFNGEENKLIDAVLKSIDLSNMFLSAKGIDKIEVDVNFIQIQLENETGPPPDIKKKRREKAEIFLNKYEEAAQITENFRKKVTINAIAFHSKPPVKAPAISSSIRKYKNEMRYLLTTRKSKWMVLRTKFGPVSQLTQNQF